MRITSMKEVDMAVLTKGEILQARALFYMAKGYRMKLYECERELSKIVEPDGDQWMGHTGDTIDEEDGSIEKLFGKLGIEFEN
ncbi:hypothetical protein LCGC14_2637360 [marine sediment metagenome]|uniref:Uncharacterized protein n=1 Tax=marine sediment metagenome TaxID=412755 RepID=A0A0F8ZYE9_9ZZZZ